ncbi:hypothetical protein JDV02_007807 [Purpureocillium takamizusanense]|uniref:Uncharacterized protein n=1 Tax=Purpureocillium takamizusanense TaxID=2060973 RepID=A0A9Q8VEI6_9HYPO|nr:uncharacterized protein JDV02_007807 [Purpureocillium takamizusanense]UNI21857.1 hypothetical protein JDV02_007807 [Purpureocillium takamizusanense]
MPRSLPSTISMAPLLPLIEYIPHTRIQTTPPTHHTAMKSWALYLLALCPLALAGEMWEVKEGICFFDDEMPLPCEPGFYCGVEVGNKTTQLMICPDEYPVSISSRGQHTRTSVNEENKRLV